MATARSVIGLIGILIIGHVLAADGVPQRGTLYLHTNDHRDVLMATNNAGNVVAIADNGPWGDRGPRTRGMQQVRRTFDGWEHDDATGLLYAGARYYDPRLGRFLSVDPAGQAVYVALGSAPLELIDRDGREWFRWRLLDGTVAFRRTEGTNKIYEPVPDVTPIPVASDMERYWDDVFLFTEKDSKRSFGQYQVIFNGLTRDQIARFDTTQESFEAWLNKTAEKDTLTDRHKRRLRTNIVKWLRNIRQDSQVKVPLLPKPASTLPIDKTQGPPASRVVSTGYRVPSSSPSEDVRRADSRHTLSYILNPLTSDQSLRVGYQDIVTLLHPSFQPGPDDAMLRQWKPW